MALVLVNTFRPALWFSLGVAFTQLLWRQIQTALMTVGEFNRLQRL